MSDNDNLNLNGIFEQDAEKKREKALQRKELTLREYLKLVEQDPLIAQNASSRLLEIILKAGLEKIPKPERWLGADTYYKLWSDKLYGVEKTVEQFVSMVKAGAAGLSTGKQIILLVGPPASGKSTFVSILKQALENYRDRPVFMIKGCPLQEEPLHLLPRYLRKEAQKKPEECEKWPNCQGRHLHLGIKIEGDLCPHCRGRYFLEDNYKDEGVIRWLDMPVEMFNFSIQGTRGIASFESSGDKWADISKLVGKENVSVSAVKGPDHYLAYTLCGELEKANRGLCEGRELIKGDTDVLFVFISVCEEKEIKVEGSSFPHISIDTLIIGHTNLTEYKKFSSKKENEALHSRIYVITFPYPLKVKDEVKIYKKLIQTESHFSHLKKCHIAPNALEIAAIFAILTRLSASRIDIDLLTKLKLYNGDKALTELETEERKPVDLREILEEGQSSPDISKREGMFGISSRDVLAALNTALIEQADLNGCLTPLKTIKALREVFEHRMGYTPEEIERFKILLSAGETSSVMVEYREFVLRAASKAFLRAYDDLAKELFNKYIEEITFDRQMAGKFIRGQILDIKRDELTGKPKEPDIKFLISVESHIPGISNYSAEVFRGEVLIQKSANPDFGYDSYAPLARAIEKKLLADSQASLSLVLASDRPKGEEERKRINDLFGALEENGHCQICAKEIVEKAREFLSE